MLRIFDRIFVLMDLGWRWSCATYQPMPNPFFFSGPPVSDLYLYSRYILSYTVAPRSLVFAFLCPPIRLAS